MTEVGTKHAGQRAMAIFATASIILGVVSLGTSLLLGDVGDKIYGAKVYHGGSNIAGPITAPHDHTLLNLDVHRGPRIDNSWAIVRGEVLDEDLEILFSFHEMTWHEEGWDDEGYWSDWDGHFDLNVTLPAMGTYYVAFHVEEAPLTPAIVSRNDIGDITLEISTVDASHIPHRMAGFIALVLGLVLRWRFRRARGNASPRTGPAIIASVAIVLGLYVGLFLAAASGYGYPGHGFGPSLWYWECVPVQQGAQAVRSEYPGDLGTIVLEDGRIYAGQIEDGQAHGEGYMIVPDGRFIRGEFEGNQPHGRVTVQFDKGKYRSYDGQMRHGLRHGEGTLVFENSDRYVGGFEDGQMHGQGTYAYTELTTNDTELTGYFVRGEFPAEAEIRYSNGDVYTGQIRDGKRNGWGTFTPSIYGEPQTGRWRDDEFVGPK